MHNCFRFRFADVRCAGASGGRASRSAPSSGRGRSPHATRDRSTRWGWRTL